MVTLIMILALLLVPYGSLAAFGVPQALRGRIGLSLVLVFTGVGHFLKTTEMAQMLPDWVPNRTLIIQLSGIMELAAAMALLMPGISRWAGIFVCIFLIAVFPANVFAAFQRVDFGGHAAGPIYLAVRLPLQLFLIGWAWRFAVRRSPGEKPGTDGAVDGTG